MLRGFHLQIRKFEGGHDVTKLRGTVCRQNARPTMAKVRDARAHGQTFGASTCNGYEWSEVSSIVLFQHVRIVLHCAALLCFASSAVNKGSDFFLDNEKLIFSSLLLRRFIEISQNSFGINS